eukprot:9609409-Lingulodinium_polyedra.AAC.1
MALAWPEWGWRTSFARFMPGALSSPASSRSWTPPWLRRYRAGGSKQRGLGWQSRATGWPA